MRGYTKTSVNEGSVPATSTQAFRELRYAVPTMHIMDSMADLDGMSFKAAIPVGSRDKNGAFIQELNDDNSVKF